MIKFNLNSTFLIGAISLALTSQSYAYTTISTNLDLGNSGVNVTNLQTFFSDNPSIYPQKLITGYFGGLTQTAVKTFQANYGIVNSGTPVSTGYGRVGPSTRDKINSLILSGGWSGVITQDTGLAYAPFITNISRTVSGNSVTIGWSTNEQASGKIFYDVNPVRINEGDVNSVGFGIVSGISNSGNNQVGTSQQISISNLNSNTQYYYMIVSTDTQGNVSVADVNKTFVTN